MTILAIRARSEARPLVQPWLSRPAMNRRNRIAGASGSASTTFGAMALRISVLPFGAKAACDWSLEFSAGGEAVWFHCPHRLLARLLNAHEPALVLDPPPAPGLLALLTDVLLQASLPALQCLAGSPVGFTGLKAAREVPSDAAILRLETGGETWLGALSGGAVADRLLATWPARLHPLPDLPVPCRLWIGATELPAAIVATLRPGDAVIIQVRPKGGFLLKVAEAWAASVQRSAGHPVLAESLRPLLPSDQETAMAANPADRVPEEIGMEALPIRLSFDVGHLDLPLSEVRRLQPGSILPLGQGLAELVSISANGRRIGTGELVDVEGTPAVRIIRLFGVG